MFPSFWLFRNYFTIPLRAECGLYHPDRKISWRKYLGAFVLSFAVLFALVGFGLFLFVPTVSGAGIMLSDIQLIFEVGLLVMTSIVAFGFSWHIRKYLARLLLVLFSIAVARIITFLVVIEDLKQSGIRLSQRQYFSAHIPLVMEW